MFRLIRWLFNHDKIDSLNGYLEVYKERNAQLEREVSELKDYRLKYKVAKMYVEDDDALIEIFEAEKKANEFNFDPRHDVRSGQQSLAMLQAAGARHSLGAGAGAAHGFGIGQFGSFL